MKRFGLFGLGAAGLISLLLCSCLGLDLNTKFAPDGSGVLTMKLRLSQQMLKMAQDENQPLVPLSKADLQQAYQNLPGVKVETVGEQYTDKDKIITAVIDFHDFSVFKGSQGLAGAGASLSTGSGGVTTYSVTVGAPQPLAQPPAAAGQQGSTDPKTQEAVNSMLKQLLDGYSLDYSVTAPRKVLSHSVGDVSADGLTVTYSIAMNDYVNLTQPVVLTVTW